MIKTIVIGGPASNKIDEKLAELLKAEHIKIEHKLFPDDESYIRYPVPKLTGTVLLVQSLYPPQDKHFVELLLMIDTAKDLGAEKVIAIVPYLAYSRQDKKFLEGEAISVKTLLKAIESAGADCIITVDLHSEKIVEYSRIPLINTSAVSALIDYVKHEILHGATENVLVLSPDKGGLKRARRAAEILGADFDYIEKFRDRVTGEVRALPRELPVEDRVVIIIDDIISTGGTIALAARSALDRGAKEVYAACTHALLVRGAYEKVRKAGVKKIVATNTIPSPVSEVDVTPGIKEALNKALKFIV